MSGPSARANCDGTVATYHTKPHVPFGTVRGSAVVAVTPTRPTRALSRANPSLLHTALHARYRLRVRDLLGTAPEIFIRQPRTAPGWPDRARAVRCAPVPLRSALGRKPPPCASNSMRCGLMFWLGSGLSSLSPDRDDLSVVCSKLVEVVSPSLHHLPSFREMCCAVVCTAKWVADGVG